MRCFRLQWIRLPSPSERNWFMVIFSHFFLASFSIVSTLLLGATNWQLTRSKVNLVYYLMVLLHYLNKKYCTHGLICCLGILELLLKTAVSHLYTVSTLSVWCTRYWHRLSVRGPFLRICSKILFLAQVGYMLDLWLIRLIRSIVSGAFGLPSAS